MTPEKMAKHNFLFMLLEGAMFYVGYSFMQTDTVVAQFIDYAAHSTVLVGLAASISSISFLLGQVIGGAYIHRVRVQSRHMVRMALVSRAVMLILSAALALGLKGPAAAWLFLLFYAVFLLTDGVVGLCWTQISARTLPVRKRGEVLGLQQTLCGILGLATGFILQKILTSALGEYAKFSIIFALAGGTLLLSVAFLAQFKDTPHPSHPELPVKTPRRYVEELVPLFRAHQGVRQVVLSRCLYTITLMALPLNYKFGQLNGLTSAQLAMLVYMPVAGRILSGVLWSQLSRLKGYPVMMMTGHALGLLSALFNILAYAMAAAGKPVMLPLCAAMILVSINSQGTNGYSQHMIAIVDEENRASYIVLLALLCAPMALSSTLAGFIAGRWGFMPVYVIVIAAACAGLVQTWHFFFSDRSPLPASQRHGAQ